MNNLKVKLHRWMTGHNLSYFSHALKVCECGKQWAG